MNDEPANDLETLWATVAALEAKVATLENDRAEDSRRAEEAVPPPNRRDLFKQAGAAAAGMVVGGVLSSASPVAADDGDALLIGQANAGTAPTTMSGSTLEVLNTASNGAGLTGSNSGASGMGVLGKTQTSGSGVQGEAGTAAESVGVLGRATSTGTTALAGYHYGSGTGVIAGSLNGPALHIEMGSYGSSPPATGTWRAGDLIHDAYGHLLYCLQTGVGSNAKWVRLSSSFVGLPTPVRVYDSRPGQLPGTGPKSPLAAATPRLIDLHAGGAGIPLDVRSALVSLVATGTQTAVGGYLSIYHGNLSWPGTSNLNWSAPNQTIAVTTLSSVNSQSQVNLYAGSVTDVVLDVLGYYT